MWAKRAFARNFEDRRVRSPRVSAALRGKMTDMDVNSNESNRSRHRIEIKLSAEQKDLIVRGAAAARQGISEFVRSAAERAATEALKRT